MLQNITDVFPKSWILQVGGGEGGFSNIPCHQNFLSIFLIKLYSHSTSMRPAIKFSHLKNAAPAWKLPSSASCALIIVVFIWCKVQLIFFPAAPLLLPIYSSGVFNQSILFPFQSQKHAAISIYSKDLSPPLFILAAADVSTCSPSSLLRFSTSPFPSSSSSSSSSTHWKFP